MKTILPLRWLLLGVGVLLIVIVGTIYLVPSARTNFSNWFALAFAPSDVSHLSYFSGSDRNHVGLSSVRFGFISTIYYPDKTFVEEVSKKGSITALLRDLSTGATEVYTVEKKAPVALTSDGRPKQNLTVSPDNALIAFSYVNTPSKEGVAEGTVDVARYELAVLDRSTGKVTSYGNGVYPHFIDANSLFYVSAKGFVLKNVATGKEDILKDEMASRVFGAPLFLSSTSLAIWNSVVGQYDIFNIVLTDPLNLSVVRAVPEFNKSIYAVTSDEAGSLYALTKGTATSSAILLRAKDGETKALYHFPEGFIPQDIAPASK